MLQSSGTVVHDVSLMSCLVRNTFLVATYCGSQIFTGGSRCRTPALRHCVRSVRRNTALLRPFVGLVHGARCSLSCQPSHSPNRCSQDAHKMPRLVGNRGAQGIVTAVPSSKACIPIVTERAQARVLSSLQTAFRRHSIISLALPLHSTGVAPPATSCKACVEV